MAKTCLGQIKNFVNFVKSVVVVIAEEVVVVVVFFLKYYRKNVKKNNIMTEKVLPIVLRPVEPTEPELPPEELMMPELP